VKVAKPEVRVAVPRVVLPSKNVIVPEATPELGATGLALTVNVTLCPICDGLAEELRSSNAEALLTVWVRPKLLLAVKFKSPGY
jgi:hypothetical protein